ncbi:MAG: hypothetical protein K6E72_05720 [Saccharofermentans sp.]|nr:hypothetical protein [Saccharofermentans sp.]
MSDFDDNWQLTGSSDPATPDIQPHQITTQAQPQVQQPMAPIGQPIAQPVYQQPLAQPVAPVTQPVAQPVQQPMAQPVAQPIPTQPGFQPTGGIQGYGYLAQPAGYQNIDYAAEREKNLNECARMINHFSPKVDTYQEYEKCKTDIVRYSRSSVAPLVWGIIICVIGLMFVYSAVTANYKDNIIGYSVAAGVIILIGAGLILMFALKKKYNKKKVESLYERLGELSTELTILYNGFSNCILPPEFTDPRILYKLQGLIMTGRCLTIGNALNALLSVQNTYMRINMAKTQFQKDTADRFEGKPAFFNAVRYMDLR